MNPKRLRDTPQQKVAVLPERPPAWAVAPTVGEDGEPRWRITEDGAAWFREHSEDASCSTEGSA